MLMVVIRKDTTVIYKLLIKIHYKSNPSEITNTNSPVVGYHSHWNIYTDVPKAVSLLFKDFNSYQMLADIQRNKQKRNN